MIGKNFYNCFDPPPPPPPPPNADLDDINEVMDELKNVLARYEGIGERLDIPNGKLEEICEQHLSPAAAMRRVITEWLKRNYPTSCFKPPTWKALVDSVEHPVGGNNTAEAEEIASRHRPSESSCMFSVSLLSIFLSRTVCNVHTYRDPTRFLAYKRKKKCNKT